MSSIAAGLIASIALVAPTVSSNAPIQAAAPAPTAADFASDLDFLLQKIEQVHPDFTRAHSREEWQQTVAAIRARLPQVDRNGFAVETLRLFRLLEDGHSDLFVPATPLVQRTWHVQMRQFAEGVFVTAAPAEFAAAVGGRVTQFGDRPIETALHDADAITWGDNPETRRRNALRLLGLVDVDRALGLLSGPDHGSFTVVDAGGKESRFELAQPLPAPTLDGTPPADWLVAGPKGDAQLPISARSPQKSWWFEALEDGGVVYFQFNAVVDDPGRTFASFCGELFDYIEEAQAERLVIDLRRNSGGNNYLNQPLIHGLIRCERVNRPGHLFVLTGPGTFSAAVNAASDLERETQALFVGEPTGAGANHFGDADLFTLPKTGLKFYCSTVRWQKSDPHDTRRWILPDLPAPATFADLLAGRDGALEAALSADPQLWESAPVLAPIGRWHRPSQAAPWPPRR